MTKYFVPEKIWPGDKMYPPYVSGGGFIMTRNLALKLAQVRDPLSHNLICERIRNLNLLIPCKLKMIYQ